jgi:ubiquinone/menaquinone biosynthesis C-methylase UbiE
VNVENIYVGASSARSFVRAISYDRRALGALARTLAAHGAARRAQGLSILDVGTGPGSFILPVAESFTAAGLDYRLDCFDVSAPMRHLFERALAETRVPPAQVNYLLADAARGLPAVYAARTYDLAFITFVLHYIGDWQRLLDEVLARLRSGGLLVQAEVLGDLRNLDGQFDVPSSMLFRQFWKQYFTERAGYSAWQPDISASDLRPVLTYLCESRHLRLFREESYWWHTAPRWGDFHEWIAHAPLSSLGSGLSPQARTQLAHRMRAWLTTRQIDDDAEVSLQWGVKISLLMKEKS